MATIVDIANRAGVSVSTVSYVLTGNRPISEETKQRVWDAVKELNYRPSARARALRNKRAQIIGLVLPSPFSKGLIDTQLEFVASTAQIASERGYGLLLWTAPTSDEDILDMAQNGMVDGLILMEITLNDARVELLRNQALPFSLIGRPLKSDGLNLVDLDIEDAVRTAVKHLVELGHTNIAFVNWSSPLYEEGYGPAQYAAESFTRVAAQLGITGVTVFSDTTSEEGFAVTRDVLAAHPQLSAIFTTNVLTIGGIVQAINQADLRIPDDFSLIALASPRLAHVTTPALTTIDFPAQELGRVGAEMLIDQLEGKEVKPQQVLVPGKLTVRQSTGRYRARDGR